MKKIFTILFVFLATTAVWGQDNFYLIGSACSAEWDADHALPMTKSGDTFTWTGQLNPGELKFLSAQGSWDNAYGSDEYDKCIWNGGDYTFAALNAGDRKFQIKLRGTYTITINGGTISFHWTDRIYPVGDGCTAGWNPSSGQYLEAVDCCSYKGKVTFLGSGEFKLLCQQDWGNHYGPSESATISEMSDYAIAEHTSDDYKYNIGLSGEYDVVLDVYAGKLYVGTMLPSVSIRAQFASNVKTAYDNSFNLYYWTAMGAGNVTMTENAGWYEATMENVFAPYNFLFNKEANNWEIKTPDVTNNTAILLCMHVTNTGVLTAAVSEECEDLEDDPAPIVRPAVKVLGLGGQWDVAAGSVMTESDDQMTCSYTVALTPGTHSFKIYTTNDYAYNGADYVMNRDYCTDVQLYSSGTEPNVQLVADMAGEYTFVYAYDTRKLSVIFPELPVVPGVPQVTLKGINNNWGGILMIPAEDGLTCSATVSLTAEQILAGWQNFKIYYKDEEENEHWLGGEVTIQRNATSGTVVDDPEVRNAYLVADFAGNYVFTYTYADNSVVVTYPEAPEVDLKGINGDWAGVQMTASADMQTYSYTYALTAGTYEFKVYFMELGNQMWLGCGNETSAEMTREYNQEFQFVNGAQNCKLIADIDGDYTFTYNATNRKVSIAFPALIPETFTAHLNGDGFASVYMPFDFTLPAGVEAYKGVLSDGEIVLTKVEQDVLPRETGLILYSETITNADITLTESLEGATEVVGNSFVGTLEPKAETNVYVLGQTSEAHSTAFYYLGSATIPANRAYLKNGGSGAPLRIRFATEVTTGVENNANANANKIIRNGRVYIVRKGRIYNIIGQIEK